MRGENEGGEHGRETFPYFSHQCWSDLKSHWGNIGAVEELLIHASWFRVHTNSFILHTSWGVMQTRSPPFGEHLHTHFPTADPMAVPMTIQVYTHINISITICSLIKTNYLIFIQNHSFYLNLIVALSTKAEKCAVPARRFEPPTPKSLFCVSQIDKSSVLSSEPQRQT